MRQTPSPPALSSSSSSCCLARQTSCRAVPRFGIRELAIASWKKQRFSRTVPFAPLRQHCVARGPSCSWARLRLRPGDGSAQVQLSASRRFQKQSWWERSQASSRFELSRSGSGKLRSCPCRRLSESKARAVMSTAMAVKATFCMRHQPKATCNW